MVGAEGRDDEFVPLSSFNADTLVEYLDDTLGRKPKPAEAEAEAEAAAVVAPPRSVAPDAPPTVGKEVPLPGSKENTAALLTGIKAATAE